MNLPLLLAVGTSLREYGLVEWQVQLLISLGISQFLVCEICLSVLQKPRVSDS